MCDCQCQDEPRKRKRRFGVLGMLVQLMLLYMILVFGGGTLIRTGNPIAVEAGMLIHTVTFVEPSIRWADAMGSPLLAGGLRTLADGVDLGWVT